MVTLMQYFHFIHNVPINLNSTPGISLFKFWDIPNSAWPNLHGYTCTKRPHLRTNRSFDIPFHNWDIPILQCHLLSYTYTIPLCSFLPHIRATPILTTNVLWSLKTQLHLNYPHTNFTVLPFYPYQNCQIFYKFMFTNSFPSTLFNIHI